MSRTESFLFEGQHEHTLDSKGRVSIPSDFRVELSLEENAELIVTRHLKERCLCFSADRLGSIQIQNWKRATICGSALRRVVWNSAACSVGGWVVFKYRRC